MTTQELKIKIKKDLASQNFIELREYLDQNFQKVWKTADGQFAENISAATYDGNGSCTNVFLVASDGHVEYPY